MSIIQQLEDLKEWSKDSTRYERRLAFRGHSALSPEAGTIPIEWDELSDPEREYYRTGPWSTREDYSKGQLVQPGPGRQGYSGKKLMSKRKAKVIRETLPQGISLSFDEAGNRWRLRAEIQKGKEKWSDVLSNPNSKQIKQFVKNYEAEYKRRYPNTLSDADFEKLRLSKQYKNLTANQFADALNKLGYNSIRGKEFSKKIVDNRQAKLNLVGEVGEKITPLNKTQQNILINAFPEYAGKWNFKADKYGLNFSEVGSDVWSLLRHTADDTKRWPTGATAKSRLWHNAYRSALKGGDSGRFRILHPIDGEIMSRDEILKYNWTKGSSNVEFLDTLTDKKFNYDGFEKWMNNDAVPGQADANRFKNAANQYDLNKKLKQTFVGDKTFGNLLNEKFKGKASKQLRFSGLINHHLHDIADNFWDTDIVFFKDNIGVARFEKSARQALKEAANLPEAEQTKFLKSFTNKFKDLGPIRLVEGEITLGAYSQGDMLKNVANQLNLNKQQTKEFLKLAPKKSLPVSYGLSSNFAGVMDDAIKSDLINKSIIWILTLMYGLKKSFNRPSSI